MGEFDDLKKRIGELEGRMREQQEGAEARDGAGASRERAADRLPDEPDRGALFWFGHHLRRRVFGGLWRWMRRRPFTALLLLLVLAYALVTGRGWYQPGFVFLRRYALLGLAGLLLLGLLWRWFRRARPLGKAASVGVTAGLVAVVVFWGAGMVNYLALYVHYRGLSKVALADLPLTGHERIQPLNAVATLAAQEAMDETEAATLPHYVRRADGRFDFTMAVGPSPAYPLQRLTRDMEEVIAVPATAPAPDFSAANRHDVRFDVGERLLFSKNAYAAAIKRLGPARFFTCSPDEARFIERAPGDWVQVVSFIRWAGVVFPRPVFGGVLVIEPRQPGALSVLERVFLGRGTWYAPEAVRSTPWLAGQNLVPERASRFSAESFRFHRGFLAPFPGYREGDIRIPEHPDDHNAMPYVTWCGFRGASERAADGLYHYFGMEPYETGKQGLNLSLFVPADGAPTVYYVDHARAESGLFGSSAVPVKVRESRKNFDWDQNAAVESRPYIRDVGGERRFFWLTTVVTKDDRAGERFIGGSIPDVTLTDARYRQVVWVDRERVGDPAAWPAQLERELASVWGLPPANAEPIPPPPAADPVPAPADTAAREGAGGAAPSRGGAIPADRRVPDTDAP
jgi:hypothetical protein